MTNVEKGAIAAAFLVGGYMLLKGGGKVTPLSNAAGGGTTPLGATEAQPASVKGKVSTQGKLKGASAKIAAFLKPVAKAAAPQLRAAAAQQADQFGAKYGLTGLGTNALA